MSDWQQRQVEQQEKRREQEYVSFLYSQLDIQRRMAREHLAEVQGSDTTGTDQGMSERDAYEEHIARRIMTLDSVERGLCFGRLDYVSGDRFYIGRIGLADEDQEPLLVDWRAPAATAFYRATAAAPDGVTRRRHLRTTDRTVIGLDDDLLDGTVNPSSLTGEAALLASLRTARTGQLTDIVATIQAEQDRAIRTDLPGILVVQGGPGTGKTVVALHRVAYLLYTHRDRLARRGVLVIGPNSRFLRYIDQVLPSLGETDVVLATIGELYPGIVATGVEPPETASVKGNLAMVDVLTAAVADRQELPEDDIPIVLEDDVLLLRPEMCRRARDRARAARDAETRAPLPHNRARAIFRAAVVAELTAAWADQLGADLLRDEDLADMRALIRASESLQESIDRLWPALSPQRLLADLFASKQRLSTAGLTEELYRTNTEWAPADVPLLDEAAELLGDDSAAEAQATAQEEADERAEIEYALGVMEIYGIGDDDPVIHAERAQLFARRYRGAANHGPTALRAATDRTWAYGHVVVDEAQECSPMAWRAIMRRCPSRSMTIVGDLAQAGTPDAPGRWADVLDRYAGRNWRVRELTVNYRTPRQIMALATRVLAAIRPDLSPPDSVREGDEEPWFLSVAPAELAEAVAAAVRSERAVIESGQLAVIAPTRLVAELNGLDADVFAPVEAKGLEFDSVIVIEPGAIWADSPCGGNDLYVALTRTTRRLGIIHCGQLPAVLSDD